MLKKVEQEKKDELIQRTVNKRIKSDLKKLTDLKNANVLTELKFNEKKNELISSFIEKIKKEAELVDQDFDEEIEELESARLNPESYLKYGFEGSKNRQTKISLSPQPVAQGKEITLRAIGSDIAGVKLLSPQGTILWNTQLSFQSKSIKIQADFQPGIYLLKIKLSTGETQVRKIIIVY